MVLAAAASVFPMAIWFGYARHVSSSGRPVLVHRAAAGRRVALATGRHGAFSYCVYIVYTTDQIV